MRRNGENIAITTYGKLKVDDIYRNEFGILHRKIETMEGDVCSVPIEPGYRALAYHPNHSMPVEKIVFDVGMTLKPAKRK